MLIQHSIPLFTQLKVRYLILVYVLASVATIVLLMIIKIDPKNLLFMPIAYIATMTTCCFWALQRCRKFKINSREIVGRLPRNVSWIKLVGLTSVVLLFSAGSAMIFMYVIFHLNAGFLESLLKSNQSLKIQPSDLFLKKSLTFLTLVVAAPVTEEFLFRGIIGKFEFSWFSRNCGNCYIFAISLAVY
jgi:uncharacterized protein